MTDSSQLQGPQLLGPRGWAVLVLAGGAALSAPFLRNPGNPPNAAEATSNPSEVDFSKKTWPDVREKTLSPTGPIATQLSEQDWAELERLKANSGTGPRRLSGDLPSTSATPLPSWAERGPRVDQLVNNSIRTAPLSPTPVGSAGLAPHRPWMGAGMKTNAEPAGSTPADRNLSGAGLSSDFVFRAPNPDARWNSSPTPSPSIAPSSQDSSSRDSGAIAGSGPFRKFEDRVKQWPDEKMLPSQQVDPGQMAWGQSNTQPSDRNADSINTVWPPVSQPSEFSIADESKGQPIPSSAAAVALPEKPDTVSAPMVSSQSGRQPPQLNGPAIEVAKPVPPTAPRQKHFIQQPAKRA